MIWGDIHDLFADRLTWCVNSITETAPLKRAAGWAPPQIEVSRSREYGTALRMQVPWSTATAPKRTRDTKRRNSISRHIIQTGRASWDPWPEFVIVHHTTPFRFQPIRHFTVRIVPPVLIAAVLGTSVSKLVLVRTGIFVQPKKRRMWALES